MAKPKKSSLLTKTGKTLLGPLNVRQLTEMLEKTSKPKHKSKIANRLRILTSRPGYQAPVAPVAPVEAESATTDINQESAQ